MLALLQHRRGQAQAQHLQQLDLPGGELHGQHLQHIAEEVEAAETSVQHAQHAQQQALVAAQQQQGQQQGGQQAQLQELLELNKASRSLYSVSQTTCSLCSHALVVMLGPCSCRPMHIINWVPPACSRCPPVPQIFYRLESKEAIHALIFSWRVSQPVSHNNHLMPPSCATASCSMSGCAAP